MIHEPPELKFPLKYNKPCPIVCRAQPNSFFKHYKTLPHISEATPGVITFGVASVLGS